MGFRLFARMVGIFIITDSIVLSGEAQLFGVFYLK